MIAGDRAIFGPVFPTADATVIVIDPTTTVGTLTLNNPFQLNLIAPTLTVDGDGGPALIEVLDGQLMFQSGGFVLASDLDLSVAPGLAVVVGAEISPAASLNGPGGLNVLGGGTVTFNGANSYGGATHISGGRLRVLNNNSLGLGTGSDIDGTFIHTGGTLEIARDTITLPNEKIIVDGGTLTGGAWTLNGPVQLNDGMVTGNGWTITGPLTASGGILTGSGWTLGGPVTLNGEITARGNGRIDGQVSGAGGVRVDSVAVVRISGNNSYTGQTTVTGSLSAGSDTALGAGSGTVADGTTVAASGQLILAGANLTNERITVAGGILSGAGTLGGPVVVDGGTLSGRITFDGPIQLNGGTVSGNVILNGPIDLTADTTIEAGSDFINGGTLINSVVSGIGGLMIEGGAGEAVRLIASNTYSGQTVVGNGVTLIILNDSALGSGSGTDADATIINAGGRLFPVGVTLANEKIILNGGILGRSAGVGVGLDPININGPIELTADSTIHGEVSNNRIIHINGSISGVGNLRIGSVTLNAANTYVGETTIIKDEFLFSISPGPGIVTANHPNSFGAIPNKLTLESGTLFVAAPITVSELVMQGGGLTGTHTLTVGQGGLTAHSGNIILSDTGIVDGVTHVTKKTDGLFDLGIDGTHPDPVIDVERGVLLLRLNQRIFNAPITVAEKHAVFGTFGGKITSDINLLNSTGYAFGGVLQNFSNFNDITGRVDLGDVGSILASGRAQLRLSGDVTGGALTLSRGELVFRSTTASYTGRTTIALDGERTRLILRDQGRLTATSEIVVNRAGTLLTHNEQIAESIPIILAGGILQVDKGTQDITTETLGQVTASSGDSVLRVNSWSQTQPTSLLIGSFDRQPGAVVVFSEQGWGELGGAGPGDPRILLNPIPQLSNGLVGGWALVESSSTGTDFATYDLATGRGVLALDPAGRPDQVEGASAADNVRVTAQPTALTGDTTINSLVWNAAPSSSLDLGGHTLNIATGGLLRTGGTLDIANGSLTAGGSQPDAELIFIDSASEPANIAADIVDNPAGSVSLVKSSLGTLTLQGNNTYTGSTTINEGVLRFVTPGSVPANTDLTVNGGDVQFDFEPGTPIPLGTVRLRHIGILSTNVFESTVSINAAEYRIDSGIINIPLSGNGALTKNSFGRLSFGADSPGFSGAVTINDGLVTLESETTLGTSNITLNGGRLEIVAPNASNQFTLAGGELASNRGSKNSLSPLTIQGGVDVTADSTVVLYAQPNARDDTRLFVVEAFDTNLILAGPVSIGSGVTLSRVGAGLLRITGDLGVAQGSGLDLVDGITRIEGVIHASDPVSSFDLSGPGRVDLLASLRVVSGRRLNITRDGLPFELSVGGGGRTVTGNGTLGNDLVLGSSATMMPGTSAGVFTVDGDYTQLINALLQIELGGTAAGEFDLLSVTGLFDAGGIFELLLIDGFVPRAGDRFDVLDFGSVVNGSAFDELRLPGLMSGLSWDASDLLVTGEIRVVPEPAGVLGAGLCLVLLRRRSTGD